MEAPSRTRSSGPVLKSMSPINKFYSSPSESAWSSSTSSFSSTFASSSSSFSSLQHSFRRSSSPTRVNLYSTNPRPQPQSVRFSIGRSVSPSRSITVPSPRDQIVRATKRTCMCSPTTHPGSFRCSLHKNSGNNSNSYSTTSTYSSNRLNARRSAMTNSLVRIGTVEGDWVKRALAALIRPSSHQQRRRTSFRPRPSRLSVMSTADDL